MQMATFMRKSTASLDDEADSIVLVDTSSVGNGQVR